jgi:hypothetical protein
MQVIFKKKKQYWVCKLLQQVFFTLEKIKVLFEKPIQSFN